MISRGSFYEVLEVLNKEFNGHFLIGVDTSARMLSLTTVREFPISILTTSSALEGYTHPNVEVVDTLSIISDSDITTLNGFRCTNIERTIIDLLRYDRNPQVIVESLSHYYHSVGTTESWEELPNLMRREGVYSKFETYIEDAEDYYNN